MSPEIEQFIEDNINLIEQNTKESWEKVYKKLDRSLRGKFTQAILEAEINDPCRIMKYIPDFYFHKSSIENYIIPSDVTSIGKEAFAFCSSLTEIVIPDSVTRMDEHAFYYCDNLIKVNYTGTIEDWVQIEFGNYSSPLHYAKNLYINNELVTTANITTTKMIPMRAFADLTSLKSVTIGGSVTVLNYSSFSDCANLTSVVITDNVKIISGYAFSDCTSLTEMIIPNSVVSIGYGAFFGCIDLTEIQFNGTMEQAIELGIGDPENTNWRVKSAIRSIVCTDGVIELA